MNKKGQNIFLEILVALAIAFTGFYTVYYAIAHWDMQCNIMGQSHGYWCIAILILVGLIFGIVGLYGAYAMLRSKWGGPEVPVSYE